MRFIIRTLWGVLLFALLSHSNVAIYVVPESLGGTNSKLLSIEHMLSVGGVPYITTSSLDTALIYPMTIFSSRIRQDDYPTESYKKLEHYVTSGNILVIPRLDEPALYDLCGIQSHSSDGELYSLTYNPEAAPDLFSLFDEPAELLFQFGDTLKKNTLPTVSYITGDAQVLASYEDGSTAITKHNSVYLWGLSWKDIGLRYLLNLDNNAGRAYSNGFEPDLDMTILLLRQIYRSHQSTTVTKALAPFPDSNVVIVTHDCDSRTSMEELLSFARYEESQGIAATYNITTHYIDDETAGDYYTPFIDTIAALAEFSHEIASHSVGHFTDFGDSTFPVGTAGNTAENYAPHYSYLTEQTTGGSLYGELEVSKALLEKVTGRTVHTFRSGYLAYPRYFIDVLEATGYSYNSSRSANDVATSFPYQPTKGQSFSGERSTIYEFPMVISDVFLSNPMDSLNWPEKVAIWDSITTRYHANGSPVVFLIHPNRDWKVLAESTYIARSNERTYYSMEQFMAFWKEREALQFTPKFTDGELTLHLNRIPSKQVALELFGTLPTLRLLCEGKVLNYKLKPTTSGQLIHSITDPTAVIHPTLKDNNVSLSQRGSQLLLNTRQSTSPLQIYTLSGKKITTILPYRKGDASHYRTTISSGSGIYILSLESWQQRIYIP